MKKKIKEVGVFIYHIQTTKNKKIEILKKKKSVQVSLQVCDGFFAYLWVSNEMRIFDLMLQEKMIQDAENIWSIDMNFESLQLSKFV